MAAVVLEADGAAWLPLCGTLLPPADWTVAGVGAGFACTKLTGMLTGTASLMITPALLNHQIFVKYS